MLGKAGRGRPRGCALHPQHVRLHPQHVRLPRGDRSHSLSLSRFPFSLPLAGLRVKGGYGGVWRVDWAREGYVLHTQWGSGGPDGAELVLFQVRGLVCVHVCWRYTPALTRSLSRARLLARSESRTPALPLFRSFALARPLSCSLSCAESLSVPLSLPSSLSLPPSLPRSQPPPPHSHSQHHAAPHTPSRHGALALPQVSDDGAVTRLPGPPCKARAGPDGSLGPRARRAVATVDCSGAGDAGGWAEEEEAAGAGGWRWGRWPGGRAPWARGCRGSGRSGCGPPPVEPAHLEQHMSRAGDSEATARGSLFICADG